ncbi:hypothetical protein N7478_000601 [Penicillium angulare]|uniref:uncharacterized protein n=1 Tax=Penicillium angulare TaxID=116970 RepID=UPI0025416E3D|nr:uncharacterized protein N7478_000601 [Penicillium angulare]KAJ5291350.1 hypothetical protein N7478_000601 [Penicillium angulare]
MIGTVSVRPTRLALLARNFTYSFTGLHKFNSSIDSVPSLSSRKFSSASPTLVNSQNPGSGPRLQPKKPLDVISEEKGGGISRIDEDISIEYPEDTGLPRTPIIQGRGGRHFKRTLAQFSLEDKVSVVTGGASGIGLALSQSIVASGSHLAIVDMNRKLIANPRYLVQKIIKTNYHNVDDEAQIQAKTLLEQFKSENPGLEKLPTVTAHYADVSNPASVDDAIADIIAKQGKIDNLVTCAGFTENFSAVTYPYDRMQKLWGVVVDGTYLFTTGVAKHLIKRQASGSMVVIGSMSGAIVNVPQPQAPYNAAKAAVRHLAASLAVEWATHDIRVNCISPGYILTALTRKILEENFEFREKWVSLIPAGRVGMPEDLMGPVTFLLSDSARYITGADLRVDGGYTLT